jgi:hypothetical protein
MIDPRFDTRNLFFLGPQVLEIMSTKRQLHCRRVHYSSNRIRSPRTATHLNAATAIIELSCI